MSHDVAVLVGSLRRDSFNRKTANTLKAIAPPGLALEIVEIGRCDRLRLHRRARFLDVLPAEPRQDAVPLRTGLAAGPQQRLVVDCGHARE